MSNYRFSVAKQFSHTPGSRYIVEGEYSGELLRREHLASLVKKGIEEKKKVIICLDGTAGYGTSFLEEAFGGLIRDDKLKLHDILSVIELISEEEPYLKDDINEYLEDADANDQV